MNIVLWVLQVLLAAAFLMFGFSKVSQPLDQLAMMMNWVNDVPSWLVRFIGASEVLGGLGLLLPGLTNIQRRLTPYAGIGLVLVMICAAAFHAMRGEYGNIGFNAVLLLIAAFVAYGRRDWL